jgi:hypothetical protein
MMGAKKNPVAMRLRNRLVKRRPDRSRTFVSQKLYKSRTVATRDPRNGQIGFPITRIVPQEPPVFDGGFWAHSRGVRDPAGHRDSPKSPKSKKASRAVMLAKAFYKM